MDIIVNGKKIQFDIGTCILNVNDKLEVRFYCSEKLNNYEREKIGQFVGDLIKKGYYK